MERRLFWGAAGRDGGTQEPLDDSEREESKRREGGKVQKGEREGKGKKERGRERTKRREGGKEQKGEREEKGKKERDREGGKGCIWTPPLGLVIAGGSSWLCALISKFTFQPPLGGGKEGSFF